MTFEASDQIEHFLSRLELQLRLPKHRKQEVVDELRSDLLTQKAAHMAAGKTQQEAQTRVLESLGDPDSLASELSSTVAPSSGGAIRIIRYLVACGIIVWGGMMMWTLRAWSYGFSPLTTGGILALHLALILVVWPGIVWRSNWLYGLVPAAICVAILIALNTAGVSSTTTIDLDAPAAAASTDHDSSNNRGTAVLAAFVAIAVYLMVAIQPRRQRIRVVVLALLAFALVEVSFLLEEMKFRADRDQLELAVQNGEDLTERKDVRITDSGEHLSLFWERKLCPGFAIAYSSETGKVWVND